MSELELKEIEQPESPFNNVWFLVAVGKDRAFVLAESTCMTEIVSENGHQAETSLYWDYTDCSHGIYMIEGCYWFHSEPNMQGDYHDDEGFNEKSRRLATAEEIAAMKRIEVES